MQQDELLGYVVDVLEEQEITYLLVGSLASGVYGEPRLTHDLDVVLELRPDQVAQLCAAFPAGDYYACEQAAREAVARVGQFNVIHPASGNKIDFMIARQDAWGRSQISRRRREQILPGRVRSKYCDEHQIEAPTRLSASGATEIPSRCRWETGD